MRRMSAEISGTTPLVSVITPSFNQGRFIEATIQSVMGQDYPHIEHIVVDGGSTDATLDILKKYDRRIRWVSEKDQGQGDAVNKGFAMARGSILGWLNSDDVYAPGAVSAAVRYLSSHPETVMLYGNADYIDEQGKVIGSYPTEPFDRLRLAEACFVCQPSVFLRSEVFGTVGPLDVGLDTCMDYDYWIRIAATYPAERIAYQRGTSLACSRMYGQNKTLQLRELVYREIISTVQKNFGFVPESWLYGYYFEIVLGKRLDVGSTQGFAGGRFRKLSYQFRQLGLLKGVRYAGRKILGRYLPGSLQRHSGAQPENAGFRGKAQSAQCAFIENPGHLRRIFLSGELTESQKRKCVLHVIADDRKLCAVTLEGGKEFGITVALPESLAARDRILAVLMLAEAGSDIAGLMRRRPQFRAVRMEAVPS